MSVKVWIRVKLARDELVDFPRIRRKDVGQARHSRARRRRRLGLLLVHDAGKVEVELLVVG